MPDSFQSGSSPGAEPSYNSGMYASSSGGTIPDAHSVEERGRLYNAYRQDKYQLPNDGEEQDRLDLQHTCWRLILGGELYLAPIGQPADVLDIGTGTGIWAIEFARQHPQANVIGTDLSLIQPTENLPANIKFEREDSEEDWVFEKPFDFIHWRLMITCFHDFKAMIQKVFDHLKPGGWAEFHENVLEFIPADNTGREAVKGSALEKSYQYMIAAGAAVGKDFNAVRKFRQWMIDAGFVDVVEKQVLVPVNGWPLDPADQHLGKWYSLNGLRFVNSLDKLLEKAGVPLDEIPEFKEQIRWDLTSINMRVYVPVFTVYGRKPSNYEAPAGSARPPA